MFYMFVSPNMAKRIEEEYKLKIQTLPNVILNKPVPESKWVCRECDREFPAYHPRRCSCGAYNFKIQEK